jgi:hypothetical protein
MLAKQTMKLNMLLVVRNFKRQNESIAAQIHKFPEEFDLLMKTVDELLSVSEMQGKQRTGLTIDKNMTRKILVDFCLRNSNKLSILSLEKGNNTLFKETHFTESQLGNMTSLKLIEKAQLIYNNVQSNIEMLAEQGLSSETQKAFSDAISTFNNFLSMPRTAIAERKKATMRINELFLESDKYLKIMDLAVESAKKQFPDFYNNYKASRELIDISSRNLSIKASAKENPKGIPIGGVVFIFKNPGTGIELKKKTTEKGNFQIKHIKPGPWKVFISKDGYKNYELSINVNENEINLLNVDMEKVEQ